MKKLGVLFLLGGLTILWQFVRGSQPVIRPQVNAQPSVNTSVPFEPGSQEMVPLQRVEDYYAPHYSGDELVWETRGKAADVFGEDRAVVRDPQLTFYEKRRADGTQRSVSFSATGGEIHRRKGTAHLSGGVTAITDEGTRLHTPTLVSEFVEKRVFTDEEVAITRPKLEIRGQRLDSAIKLERFTLQQGVRMVLRGTELDFLGPRGAPTETDLDPMFVESRRKAPRPDDPAGEDVLIITSDGPLFMERLDKDEVTGRMRHRVTLKDNVLLLRQQLQAVTTSLATDTLEILFLEDKDARGQGRLAVEVLHSSGDSRLSDRRGTADADSMVVENDVSGLRQTMSFMGPYKWFTLAMPRGFSLTPGVGEGNDGASGAGDGAATGVGGRMEITCAGNARFVRGQKGERLGQTAEFENQVLVRSGTMSLLCRHLTVEFAPPVAGDSGAGGTPEISSLVATGDVLFVDAQVTARSDLLEWDRAHQGIRLSGERPAEVLQNRNRLSGRRITIDQVARLVTCEEDAVSVVQLPQRDGPRLLGGSAGTDDSSWRVSAKRQEIRFGEGMKDLQALVALGDVSLDGGKQRAFADKLTWVNAEDRMVLRGDPFARILDREHVIESSSIRISPKRGIVLLEGRKRVTVHHLVGAPGAGDRRRERITISCTGDAIVVNNGSRMHFLRDVVVRREQGRIRCDKLIAYVNTDRNEVERVVSTGNVVVSDAQGSAVAAFLGWNLTTRELVLKRHPYALVHHEGSLFVGEEITASQDWRNITAINRKSRGRILLREGARLPVPDERGKTAGTTPDPPTQPRKPLQPSTTPEEKKREEKPSDRDDRRRPDRR